MNKKTLAITVVLLLLMIVFLVTEIVLPSKHEKECKERVFEDLIEIAEDTKNSVIGIVSENNNESQISHNGLGSAVIFKKDGNKYYALTALHVIEKESNYKVFTINTKFSGKTIKADENVSFEIPDEEYYKSLLDAKIEYTSEINDLAIISFVDEEELKVIELETDNPKKGSRVIAIGHTESNRYNVTYGYITSALKEVKLTTKGTNMSKTDKVFKHNAYLNYGNSGGALINENGKLVGINIGGTFNKFGYFDEGYMLPLTIIKEELDKWEGINNNE